MKTIEEIDAQIAALQAEKDSLKRLFHTGDVYVETCGDCRDYYYIIDTVYDDYFDCYVVRKSDVYSSHKHKTLNWKKTSLTVMDVFQIWIDGLSKIPCMKTLDVINAFEGKEYYLCSDAKTLYKTLYIIGSCVINDVSTPNYKEECYRPATFDEFKESVRRVFKNIEEKVQQ